MKKGCIKTCTIFYILFIMCLVMFGLTIIYSGDLKHLDNILDKEQLVIYEKIKKERLNHFYTGLGVGGILGLGVILSNINVNSKYCLAGIILLFATSMIYYILPKSDYMVRHLKTEEQKLAWMTIQRNFIKKKIASFIGIVVLYFCVPFVF
jgi:hypothetical protein